MAKKVALGKGLASLIPAGAEIANNIATEDQLGKKREVAVQEANYSPYMVNVKTIRPNPNQPRKIFKEKDLRELAVSIKENGVIQPLVVTKIEGEEGFELVAGERRLKAARSVGIEQVPVIIKKITDREKMIMAIIENVQRSDLNCIEEALGYFQLMNDYNLTQEEVAGKIGKERSTIANFLRILKLPREVVELLQKELLSFGHGKVLASIKDREQAVRMANAAITKNLTVRELEKLIKSDSRKKREENADESFPDERLETLREKLEQKTGFHFAMKEKKNGAGEIIIKYNNEAELNDVYEFLLKQ